MIPCIGVFLVVVYFWFGFFGPVAYVILAPRSETELRPLAVDVRGPNHGTARLCVV